MAEKMSVPQQNDFDRAVDEYLAWLRENPEELMEAPPQASQREIFVESFRLIRAANERVHYFNELLVQWKCKRPRKKKEEIRQVVPDNMVVLYDGELDVPRSWNVPEQPVRPFWVLEYVSKDSERKDFEISCQKYEEELKVPYYLTFYPDIEELTLRQHTEERYITVVPNDQGRCAVPEIEVEVGLVEGWVRFWHRGRLLPLPDELQRQLEDANRRADDESRRANDESRRADRLQDEVDRLRAELARLRPDLSGS